MLKEIFFISEYEMIIVTKLDDEKVYINPETILSIESVGDTFITFINRHQLRVKETPEVIRDCFMNYKKDVFRELAVEVATKG